MSKSFRFGVQIGGSFTPESFVTQARRAEELGYSTMYFPDHFIDTELAPMVAMATAASATKTLKVGALVFDNDYKHPSILAKEVATIDVLSGGRTELGVGAGWMEVDYTALGIPYDRPGVRIERLEEALQIIAGCYGPDAFSFSGAHYTVTDYQAIPKPTQAHVPILIGGGGPRVLRLAGKYADIVGINPNMKAGTVTADAMTDSLAGMIDQKVGWIKEGAGARFDDIELQIRYFLASITDDRQRLANAVAPGFGVTAEDALDAGLALVGTVDEVCDLMETRRERWGVSYAVIGGDEMEMFAPVVERLTGK
ncbi:MAG: TIGR03621 family F420-dependent LLM class oxidoreductase [Acidimicrobiia bacterium]|nr:TIGR03621 family F420-dependent LLM class oxidoreductase [Acidimicrobiia bacterium]